MPDRNATQSKPTPAVVPAMDGAARADSPESDAALVAGLKSGDPRAYERLVREVGPRLLATAQRMLGNEDDARDALQDTFLSAVRNISRFDEKSRLSTWMHRIAINASLMKLRTRRRKPAASLDELTERARSDGRGELGISSWREPLPSDIDDGTRAAVRELIETLPDEYRTVLLLRDVEDLDTREAATVLQISESAVKTRLHRARQALRELLDARMGGRA
ncbi:MAG TPA: sigma-70 family RNA polymerase sigma factor [Phycisphaerales bacterium]|nr:sigma-70 family RNA polymerase sigma factor [Phycisphaerales bacterium]